MPIPVAFYKCSICGKIHDTEELAILCESYGKPEYRFSVGQVFPELNGATIIGLTATNKYRIHMPAYLFDRDVPRSRQRLLTEPMLIMLSEHGRRCPICGTIHETLELMKVCESLGAPLPRWRLSQPLLGGMVVAINYILDQSRRAHLCVYRIRILGNRRTLNLTEEEVLSRIL